MPTLEAIIDASGARRGAAAFNRAKNRIVRGAKSMGTQLKSLRTAIIGGFATFAVIRASKAIIRAVAEQEKTIALLNSGLKATRGVSGQTIGSLRKLSAEMQRLTTFSNETVEAAEAVLLSFTNIRNEAFERTIRVAADVSTVMGTDLRSSIVQLGKAINDPIANLGALSRSGIQFSKIQKTMIKELVSQNRLFEAQSLVLTEIEKQYGGAARAARDTLGGAIINLRNDFDDLLKSIGQSNAEGVREAVEALSELIRTFSSGDFARELTKNFTNLRFDLKRVSLLIKDDFKTLVEETKKTLSFAFPKITRAQVTIPKKRGMVIPRKGGFAEAAANVALLAIGKQRAGQERRVLTETQKQLIVIEEQRAIALKLLDTKKKQNEEEKKGRDIINETAEAYRFLGLEIKDAEGFAKNFGNTVGRAFEDMIFSAKNLRETIQGLVQDIARLVFRKAVTEQIAAGITGMIGPTPEIGGDITKDATKGGTKGGGDTFVTINAMDTQSFVDAVARNPKTSRALAGVASQSYAGRRLT